MIELELLTQLKNLKELFHTDTDFADAMDMDRLTLIRILTIGKGSEDSCREIKRKLQRFLQ